MTQPNGPERSKVLYREIRELYNEIDPTLDKVSTFRKTEFPV